MDLSTAIQTTTPRSTLRWAGFWSRSISVRSTTYLVVHSLKMTKTSRSLPTSGFSRFSNWAYSLKETEGLTNRDVRAFAAINSVFNCWPYWRELAQSLSQRMNLKEPLVIPVRTVNTLLSVDRG